MSPSAVVAVGVMLLCYCCDALLIICCVPFQVRSSFCSMVLPINFRIDLSPLFRMVRHCYLSVRFLFFRIDFYRFVRHFHGSIFLFDIFSIHIMVSFAISLVSDLFLLSFRTTFLFLRIDFHWFIRHFYGSEHFYIFVWNFYCSDLFLWFRKTFSMVRIVFYGFLYDSSLRLDLTSRLFSSLLLRYMDERLYLGR